LRIDFEFDEEIHDTVREFVLAPENIKNVEWFSLYQVGVGLQNDMVSVDEKNNHLKIQNINLRFVIKY
jgi:hypothetical protein